MNPDTRSAPIDIDRLLQHLACGDDRAVIEAFRGRTEPERRAVAKVLFALQRRWWGGNDGAFVVPPDLQDTATAALFACGTLTEIKRLRHEHRWGYMCHDTTYQVLIDRRPSWATAWAIWALDREATPSGRAGGMWTLVRHLIRAGVCDPIDTDGYIIGMIFGAASDRYDYRQRWIGSGQPHYGDARDGEEVERHRQRCRERTVATVLRDDPELLGHEIWRIFEVPARPSRQLAAPAPGDRHWWIEAFRELSGAGDIDRKKVLAATLDALARDITQHQARWFIALWHAFEPTTAERSESQEQLLHLLAHPVGVVVQFSLAELDRLEKADDLDTAALLGEVEGVLLTMPVATARHALRLVERIGASHPELRIPALITSTSALLHVNPSVQEDATKLLVKRGAPAEAALWRAIELNLDGLTDDQVTRLNALRVALPAS